MARKNENMALSIYTASGVEEALNENVVYSQALYNYIELLFGALIAFHLNIIFSRVAIAPFNIWRECFGV